MGKKGVFTVARYWLKTVYSVAKNIQYMRSEYYEVYATLYTDYVHPDSQPLLRSSYRPGEISLVDTVINAIDGAERGSFLRPDARYFLLVNFHHLIIEPMLQAARMNLVISAPSNRQLEGDIRSDIAVIIDTAARSLDYRSRNQDLISGHQIMRTIDQVWQQLKTTKFETWG